MKIVVHQRGGILGLDRQVEVEGGLLKVSDRGRPSFTSSLDADEWGHLQNLATRLVATGGQVVEGPVRPVSDGVATEIAIAGSEGTRTVRLQSGDVMPTEVRDLLREISAVSRPAQASRAS